MNERIYELAKQAELNVTLLFNKEKLQNFSELIVRECAEYAEHNLDMAGYKKKFMLKHFGVEE